MKDKGKSKSKEVYSAEVYNDANYLMPPGQKFKINRKKMISITYFDGKVQLGLEIGDEKMLKMVQSFFNKATQELQFYSILHHLKMYSRPQQIEVYRHNIDTKQALSFIFHLQQIKKGNTELNRQITDMVSLVELQKCQLMDVDVTSQQFDDDTNKQFDKRRIEFNNAIKMCRNEVKEFMLMRNQQKKINFPQSEDRFKLKVLQMKVRELGLKLFDMTVVGLMQVNEDDVQIIYQQCYPAKVVTINYLKDKIGDQMYLKKKMAFIQKFSHIQKSGINNTNLIVCHICKQLAERQYIRCSRVDMQPIALHYTTSPQIYYKRLIAFDYCYDSGDAPSLPQELNYYIYSRYPNKRRYCNRIICHKCLKNVKINKVEEITKHHCLFCKKRCQCASCVTANEIVRCLAYSIDILESNLQEREIYEKLVKYVNFDQFQFKSKTQLRSGFKHVGKEEYLEYYHDIMDNFEQKYKIIEEYRHDAVTCPEQLSNPSFKLTPQLKQICSLINKSRFQGQSPTKGKSLAAVKQCNQQYQRRIKAKKKEKGEKQGLLRKKFAQKPDIHNILRKYSVTNREPMEVPNQFMTINQQQQMQEYLMSQLQPMQEDKVELVSYIKEVIPLKEQDYQKLNITSQQFKIRKQRELHQQKLIQRGILKEITDPQYYPENYQYSTFFQDMLNYLMADQEENVQTPQEEDKLTVKHQPLPEGYHCQQEEYSFNPNSFNSQQIKFQQIQGNPEIKFERKRDNQMVNEEEDIKVEPQDQLLEESSNSVKNIDWKQFSKLEQN